LFEFGSFVLDPAKHQLLRDGEAVPLTPKTFDLLRVLVENHDRMLSKEELIKTLWPDSYVDQSNLTQQISMIRRALGESAGESRFVTTVPARGYRFTAAVTRRSGCQSETGPAPAAAVEPPHGKKIRPGHVWPWIAAAGLLLASGAVVISIHGIRPSGPGPNQPKSLAVLPFQNLKHDGENDFLGFSLADAVITKLGPVGSLSVRPSSSVERYRGAPIDLRAAAADLHVDALLTGNFVHDGEDLRITAQLTNVKTESILWRSSMDLKYDKLLIVHDVVAREIVKGLRLSLTPSEVASLEPDPQVEPAAYEFFLRGVDLYSRNDFPTAIQMLRKSADAAPNYALTWAHLGRALTANASFELGGHAQYEEAQQAYERALSLNPALIEARVFMANLLTDTGKVEDSVPLLRDALRTNANHPEVHWELGYAYRFSGMLEESVAECERARRLDPGVKLYTSTLNGYLYLGRYDRFLQSLPPDNGSALILFYRGFGEYHQRNMAKAAEHFDAAFQARPSLLHAKVGKALRDGINGQPASGLEAMRDVDRQISARGVGDPEAAYKVAQALAALGDAESSLRALRRSIEGGFFSYPYFVTDPLLAPLRDKEEFSGLLQIARARHEAFKRRFF
jgi:DNA-binding winged helix-turn-helix (wHTH) protein/TolB-like protein/tetratricopeptide (TPR) repeat protein